MKCVDTDFLIAVLKGDESVREKAEELDELGSNVTTVMNTFELYIGAFVSKKKRHHIKDVERLLSRFSVLTMNENSARKSGEIYASSLNEGEMIDIRDAIISGIALANNCSVVTRNIEHFKRVKELKVEKW